MRGDKKNHAVTVRTVRNRAILFYTIVMTALYFTAFSYAFINMRQQTNKEIADDMAALSLQYLVSLNNFTGEVEEDCTDVLRAQEVLSYDPITNKYAEYDDSTLKGDVKKYLLELATGNMYIDFMTVFSDNTTAGKVSSGASDLISRHGFDYFNSRLGGHSDTWFFDSDGRTDKLYYICKMSDHSLFLVSMYTQELDRILALGGSADEITMFLTEGDRVIYTNYGGDTSGGIPDEYRTLFKNESECVTTEKYVGASLMSDSGWRICIATKSASLIEISPLTAINAFFMLIFLIAIAIVTGVLACAKFTTSNLFDPSSEFIDPLTGTFNEYGLDEKISELMDTSIVGSTYAFILLRLKDYKHIKTAVTLRYWNSLRSDMVRETEKFFADKKTIIGRVSDEAIAVFADFSEFDIFKAHENLKDCCTQFCRSFDDFTAGSSNDIKLGISMGVCIYPDHAEDFDGLLENARTALEKADESDGGSPVFYEPNKKDSKDKEGVR